ncbi:MAG: nucleoside phosphorylase [Marinifilaceae bacterium]
MNKQIAASELIINGDGSIFHLHLLPEELADNVILVGDPARVEMIGKHFEHIEVTKKNREFVALTGSCKGQRLTVISTGIGPDNIDIVLNELDALANIDLKTRMVKDKLRSLNIVRIGTSGAIQPEIKVGSYVVSEKHVGCDGVIRFYEGANKVCDRVFEDLLIEHCQWVDGVARPYVVSAAPQLVEKLCSNDKCVKGVTLTAVGFYGPQGRELRLPIAMQGINERLASFTYQGYKITNYEMESATITGLSNLLGHNATTICLIIANRATGDALSGYHEAMEELVKYVLRCLTEK